MSMSDVSENNLLLLLFNNTNWANIGDATGLRGSTVAGSFFIALHTTTLTDTSDQTSGEAAYTSYARQAVARSSAGWTVSGTNPAQAANAAIVSFPQCTGGSETETNFSIGRATSGAGEILFGGPLTTSLAVSNLITPTAAIGQLKGTID